MVISSWYPNRLHPAEGDFIRYQTRMMHGLGMDISVFHASLSIRYFKKGIFKAKRTEKNVELKETIIEKLFWPRNNRQGLEMWAKKYVEELDSYCTENGWPDVIWAHTYLGGYVASLTKTKFQIPFVLTLHESYIVEQNVPLFHRAFLKKPLHSADRIVAVGDCLKQNLSEYTSRAISVIPNFIDFDLFRPTSKKYKSYTFIYVGELIERKRVDQLLIAFDKFSQVTKKSASLIIIGDGIEMNRLKKLRESLKHKHSIEFKGRLDQHEVAENMSKSNCLVLPSETESFGIVLIEAMASGIPFICNSKGVPKSQFNHPSCYFEEIESLDISMQKCFDARNVHSSEFIRSFARGKFGAEVVVSKYLELFEEVVIDKT